MNVAVACSRCGRPMQSTGIRGMCPRCLFACTTAQFGEPGGPEPAASIEAAENLCHGQTVGAGGRFLLLDRLGEGGMGEVWLASDQELSQENEPELVALKFLSREIRHNPRALSALRTEVLRSQRLSHPNIVRIFDLHTHQKTPFIKMEYVEGNSLRHWLDEREESVMPWRMAVPITQQLANALRYAHETEGIVHRDLKPGNLLLCDGPVIKLSDFGIAAVAHDTAAAGVEGQVIGTLWYASPQQLSGQRPRPEDDIYALGVTLYELLTGSLPFEADSSEKLIRKVRYEPPQPVPERLRVLGRRNDVPARMVLLVHRCLEKDPFLRPKTQEIPHLLPSVLAQDPVLERPAPRVAEEWSETPTAPTRASKAWLWWLVGGTVLGLVWCLDWGGVRSRLTAWLSPEQPRPTPPREEPGTSNNLLVTNGLGTTVNGDTVNTNQTAPPPPVWGQVAVHLDARNAPFHALFQPEGGGQDYSTNSRVADFTVALPAGRYSLTVWDVTRWTNQTSVVVEENSTSKAALAFTTAYLRVTSEPPGALVTWSHPKTSGQEPRQTPFTDLFLSGQNRFEVAKGDYVPLSTNYWFNPVGATNRFNVVLLRCSHPVRGQSWTNSLGMAFRWVGPFWACVTETRVSDFRQFVQQKNYYEATNGMWSVTAQGWQQVGASWSNPGFVQTDDHPVIGVNWYDAANFCKWLTEYERAHDLMTPAQSYQLPSSRQWFQLAGEQKFPWGDDDTEVQGNYAGVEVKGSAWPECWPVLTHHRDNFPRTAPVYSFEANARGFYHLGGNAAEWCADKVLCGKSWFDGEDDRMFYLLTRATQVMPPAERHDRNGFRVIVIEGDPAAVANQ